MKAHLITSLLLLMSSNVGLAAQNRLFFTVNAHLVDTRLDPIVNPGTFLQHVLLAYFSPRPLDPNRAESSCIYIMDSRYLLRSCPQCVWEQCLLK